jgi:serine/threonine protein kinase
MSSDSELTRSRPAAADTAARDGHPEPSATRTLPETSARPRAPLEVPPAPLAPQSELHRAPRATFVEGYKVRGRYLLEELIGQGAMGQVWRARDLLAEEARERNPRVALKALNADLETRRDAFVAMHREAARAQKLAHPNVVTVYVFDRDEASGRAFIAMELLAGRPLDEVIRTAGPEGLRRERALPIIRGMAEGLAYAHRRGIVHSDFKPANVFLTNEGTPKILDFGIARAVRVAGAPGAAEGAEESDDVGFQGLTPAYAAPETIEDAAPNPAQDVFALGIVALELVTGINPFRGRSSLDAQRDPRFARPPLRGLRRRESRAIERALAFDPKQRFADAGAFLRALQGIPVIQKMLVAAVALLTLAAGGLWYRSYLESLPNEPLEQLPLAVQRQFLDKVREGNESLAYVERTHDIRGSKDAAQYFADAYRLHPKDPQAVQGLDIAADYAIGWYGRLSDRQTALAGLERFRAISPDYYERYKPLQRAIHAAGGK